MLAILALGSLALEDRLALMACPTHTLRRRSSCHLFPSCAVCHGEAISLLVQPVIGGDSPNGSSFALGSLGPGARKLRTFLATSVLTMAADSVGAECRLTAVAVTMDPHANLFLHSRHACRGGYSPLSRLQCHSIFGKESTGLLFLDCIALLGRHGGFGFAGSGNGPVFFDDL